MLQVTGDLAGLVSGHLHEGVHLVDRDDADVLALEAGLPGQCTDEVAGGHTRLAPQGDEESLRGHGQPP